MRGEYVATGEYVVITTFSQLAQRGRRRWEYGRRGYGGIEAQWAMRRKGRSGAERRVREEAVLTANEWTVMV